MTIAVVILAALVATGALGAMFQATGNAVHRHEWAPWELLSLAPKAWERRHDVDEVYVPVKLIREAQRERIEFLLSQQAIALDHKTREWVREQFGMPPLPSQ